MRSLPGRPDIDQLKRQAKDLLADYRRSDPAALERFRNALPAAAGLEDETIARQNYRLHDAQSCVAREYGFPSWTDLKSFVEAKRVQSSDPAALELELCRTVYAGDIAGGMDRARPHAAARLISDNPSLAEQSPWIACAVGDIASVQRQIERDPLWVNRPGGPLNLPPLVGTFLASTAQAIKT